MKRRYQKRNLHNIWRSYSDMMAGLLLLFVLVMSIALISLQESYEAEVVVRKEQEALSKEIEQQKKVMEEQQTKIDKIIGIKAELISNLKKEFMNKNLKVSIDEDTGAIIFDANVLFAYNDSNLTTKEKLYWMPCFRFIVGRC